MQALIIYDKLGNSYHTSYGSVVNPEGLSFAQVDVPEGQQLIGMDMSNPENPTPIFESTPASAYTELTEKMHILDAEKNALSSKLIDTELALCEQYEMNLALLDELEAIKAKLNV